MCCGCASRRTSPHHTTPHTTGRREDDCWEDGCKIGPSEVHSYLTRVMYNRRNKFNPLWNSLVIAGKKKGKM